MITNGALRNRRGLTTIILIFLRMIVDEADFNFDFTAMNRAATFVLNIILQGCAINLYCSPFSISPTYFSILILGCGLSVMSSYSSSLLSPLQNVLGCPILFHSCLVFILGRAYSHRLLTSSFSGFRGLLGLESLEIVHFFIFGSLSSQMASGPNQDTDSYRVEPSPRMSQCSCPLPMCKFPGNNFSRGAVDFTPLGYNSFHLSSFSVSRQGLSRTRRNMENREEGRIAVLFALLY